MVRISYKRIIRTDLVDIITSHGLADEGAQKRFWPGIIGAILLNYMAH